MRRAVVVLSGGQDSTTCLAYAKKQYDEVACVTFDYGQLHVREIECAKIIAKLMGVGYFHDIVRMPDILKGTSPLVNRGQALEQYQDWQSLPGGLEKTFVPMRNQLFLTIAANRAAVWGACALVTGVCEEDYGGYPDCRLEFICKLRDAIRSGMAVDENDPFASFDIDTPLMHMSKADSIHFAMDYPGCYGALGFSHTAYDGQYPPLGHDHATLLRAKGFEQAGVPDPLVVRAYWEGLMPLPETDNYREYFDRIRNLSPWLGDNPIPMSQANAPTYIAQYAEIMAAKLEKIVHV